MWLVFQEVQRTLVKFCSCYFSSISRKSKDGMKIIATAFFGVTFGFLIGISFPSLSITKVVESTLIFLCLCLIRFVPLSSLENFVFIFQVSLPTNFLPSNDLSSIEEKGSKIATPESHKAWSSSKGNDSSSSVPIDKSKACFYPLFYLWLGMFWHFTLFRQVWSTPTDSYFNLQLGFIVKDGRVKV